MRYFFIILGCLSFAAVQAGAATYYVASTGWTVDKEGQTIDFLLCAKGDSRAVRRFFEKILSEPKNPIPRVINVDKNPAFPTAVDELKEEGLLPKRVKLRPVKYLNNIIEQDHRFIKRRVSPGLGFFTFDTAWATLRGYETMHMIRKGRVKYVSKDDVLAQNKSVENLFGLDAWFPLYTLPRPHLWFLRQNPWNPMTQYCAILESFVKGFYLKEIG